ncbi:type VI secretion system lipoprotein TssJ [Duganella sp. FT3S]|uniref:Type VI secretion system lipoprotein TssJ n=1 Tax=Rugamonas fusca TaxID=2758568 RepID=A0A7W2EM09_9BURK|nr:type VI secretion system lipoprotein TssJ [Rugamonas fusca]MBA5608409.1 type VI secretion system lipoprotein TssJ [Rugamonas fusca]
MNRSRKALLCLTALLTLSGCAAGSIAGTALEMIGIRQPPELPDAQKPPRQVAIRLHASPNLNTDANGHPLALVARIYKLRQDAAFRHLGYDSFLNAHTEHDLLGNDLLEVKEVLLVPGQRYEVVEKVTREAAFIGVVALFRAPAEQRWRMSFAAGDAEKDGITIGAHACALSVGSGATLLDADRSTSKPLAALRCP